MIKNRLRALFALLGLLSLWALPPAASQAQRSPTAPLAIQHQTPPSADEQTVSFARLGATEQQLRGPFDAATIAFSLPATWQLTDGVTLQLHLATFFAGQGGGSPLQDQTSATEQRSFGGTLQIVLNGETIQTILLDQLGERTVSVPIRTTLLDKLSSDGRQQLRLLLDTNEQCGLEQYTSLIVRSSSSFILPHRTVAPPTDLALLPRPIYQRSFLPDAATVVVPDAPSPGELQAALTTVAGLGRITGSDLQLSLTPIGRLTPTMQTSTHLIVVGKPSGFAQLAQLGLDGAAADTGDDGLIQMLPSPWSPSRVVLLVSGTSDAAVIKAAQALSTGAVRGSERSDRALVAAIQPRPADQQPGIDRSFAELGYDVQTLYGQGAQYTAYRFELPQSQVITDAAYLDLSFVHTGLLDYDQSGLMLSLNDEPIASVRLDDTSTRLSNTRIALPASALRAGDNLLVLRGDLLPRALCTDPRSNDLWLSIRADSLLHLPLAASASTDSAQTLDLKRYPQPFSASANLERLAFVLADDPAAWQVAATIARDLGQQTRGTLIDLAVVSAAELTPELRDQRDLIVVGRPSQLPLLGELGSALPAPFAAGSDLAANPRAPVVYRSAADERVGYVQLLSAPWNKQRAVLAVLGSGDQGLAWAGAALTTDRLRSTLAGNLAIVHGEQIDASDTRPPTAAAQTTAEPSAESAASKAQPARALLLAAAAVAVLLLAICVALAVWLHRRRRFYARPAADS